MKYQILNTWALYSHTHENSKDSQATLGTYDILDRAEGGMGAGVGIFQK